ncbi:MAG: signal peptidase II [Clostridia bacterium]|nr:signal peptidase II [Clostridia bacterium]
MLRTVWVGVLAFLADRISKQLAVEWLELDVPKVLWDGVLNLTYTQNTGMAFNILADRTWLLILLSSLALIILVTALYRALPQTPMSGALLWLMLAGGVGNLVDRLLFGYVVDFFSIQFVQFPVFNVADVCLTVAAVFLVVALLRHPDEKKANEEPAA